jgi:hypothetical protein
VSVSNIARPADVLHSPVFHVAVESLLPADPPRSGRVDEVHAALLAETDPGLPPIVVHRPTMRVIDGMHRLHAAARKGQREIAVRFFDGSEAEAFVLAVELNISHGLPLSLADRKAAAGRILAAHAGWAVTVT